MREALENEERASLFLLFLLLVLIDSLAFAHQQQQPLSSGIERDALLSLRSSLGLRSRDWPIKTDPCSSWFGVQCDSVGRVIGLQISGLRRSKAGKLNPNFSIKALPDLSRLNSFNASGFYLPGSIPDLFGKLVHLHVLDLSFCSVNGSIPASLGNLQSLTVLNLSGNALTGTLPLSLGQLSQLTLVDFSHNALSGSIPSSFSALRSASVLNISGNHLTGTVPDQLTHLSLLVELDLGFNSLSGKLPENLGSMRSLQTLLLGNNLLSGSLPIGISNLIGLHTLVLNRNFFSGSLPNSLWILPRLHLLDVSHNNFTGILPQQISKRLSNAASARNTTAMFMFNLSHNLFYGSLSSQFVALQGLYSFDLSDNYFEGRIPDGNHGISSFYSNCLQGLLNQRSFEDCTEFYVAKGLLFDGPPVPSESPSSCHNTNDSRYILAGVFGGLGLIVIVVIVIVWIIRWHEGGAVHSDEDVIPVTSRGLQLPHGFSISLSSLGEAFTYEQLIRATADFSSNNLMKHGHSGDLYQGVLEGGIPVVVKRMDARSVKKDAYMVELDLFGWASHPRLVPFLGHCLDHETEKLLVYKYMPNGDLSNALYRKTNQPEGSLQSLDWITRLKIAIGAAEALSYLHHECTPPLVHRDVQASSVLLDDKFEVCLGSLSEICVQECDTHQSVISRLLRFSQNSDQGLLGSPSATCAYDVYCLGKVLLELVTGKLGISGSNDANTNEWLETVLPYINIYEKEMVTQIVDPSLIIDEDLLEEVWAMAIVAKSCLNPKPSKRPFMRYIHKALENPLKVVRVESANSARLTTTSSRRSWNAALFGSWRHSSSEIVAVSGPTREIGLSSIKQSGTEGIGQGGHNASSQRKFSKEIFPEPYAVLDAMERQEEA